MAKQEEGVPVSEAQIAVHWREEEYYQPSPKHVKNAPPAHEICNTVPMKRAVF